MEALINIDQKRVIAYAGDMAATFVLQDDGTFKVIHAAPIDIITMSQSWSNEGLPFTPAQLDENDPDGSAKALLHANS